MPSIVSAIPNLYSEETHKNIIDFIDNEVFDYTPTRAKDHCNRHIWNDLDFFKEEHHRLSSLVSKVFEEPVVPTYTCLSLYDETIGILPPHIDRPRCRYTLSYMIRCSDIPFWPIYVAKKELSDQEYSVAFDDTPKIVTNGLAVTSEEEEYIKNSTEWAKIDHSPNSAAFFSGTHRWHYRDEIPKGSAQIVLFHYLPLHPDRPRPETDKPPLV